MKWLRLYFLLETILLGCGVRVATAQSAQVSVPVQLPQAADGPSSSTPTPLRAGQETSVGSMFGEAQFEAGTSLEPLTQLGIGLNFTSSTFLVQSGFIPPDTMGSVGSHHIVELINGRYSVYRKSDGALIQTSSLNQFWSAAGVGFTGSTFDPRILYDPYSERWFACSVDNANGDNHFLIAVSSSSDPTTGWVGFAIDSDSTDRRWADYPTLGLNGDGVYVSANMFPIPGRGATGLLIAIVAIPKIDLLGGTPGVAGATIFESVSSSITGISVQPVVELDNQGQPAALLSNFQTGSGLFKRLNVTGDITSPILDTSGGLIAVSPFLSISSADQPGPKQNLEILNGSIFHTNVVKQNGAFWGVQTVNRQGRAALRWFQIDADTNTLLQEGLIANSELNFFYGSIAVNKFDDVVIGFSGSGETQFASSYAVTGTTFSRVTTFGPPVQLKPGNGAYLLTSSGRNRWGDYSATVIDPADPFAFWTFQEFVSSEDRWSTQVTQLVLPPAEIVNNFVTLVPLDSTFETTSDTSGCPSGFLGRFSFDARLTNEADTPLSHLMMRTIELTNGNLLENADYGPRGEGAAMAIAKTGGLADGLLSPNESVDVRFSICLNDQQPFRFFVDALGRRSDDESNSVVQQIREQTEQ